MAFVVVIVVDYPTPSEGRGHGGKPWSPRVWLFGGKAYLVGSSPEQRDRKCEQVGQTMRQV